MGPRCHILDRGTNIPTGRGTFEGRAPAHCNIPTYECIAYSSSRCDKTTMLPFIENYRLHILLKIVQCKLNKSQFV